MCRVDLRRAKSKPKKIACKKRMQSGGTEEEMTAKTADVAQHHQLFSMGL